MENENFVVDRLNESEDADASIVVIFPDNHKIRFWLMGLSDEEYIRRAKIIRENENE